MQKTVLVVIVTGLLLIILGIALRILWPHSLYTFDRDRVAVIKEIKELNRLETAQYTIEKVIDAQTNEGGSIRQFLFGDKILLIAHGEIIAGFDMAKIQDSDIQVQGKNLTVNLPAPEILVSRIDNDKTKVYDRSQGLLTKGDANLESEARKEAESEIRKAACDSGILEQATNNAKKQLTAMFTSLDFDTVTLNVPTTTCQ